jgi:putative transposase
MEAREDNGISLFMKFLGCKYVYYVNKNYGRTGTLWEGRFKACLIEDGPYFVSCLRYIEANPLRSGLIKSPELYKWSSYKVRALGEESRHIKVDIDNWYNSLSDEALKRQDMYRKAFVNYSYGRTCKLIEKATLNGAVLGTAGFKKWVENTLGRQIIVRMPGRPTLKETAVGR